MSFGVLPTALDAEIASVQLLGTAVHSWVAVSLISATGR